MLTKNQNTFSDKIRSRTTSVAIIGMGYVGLPLALRFAENGFRVTGIDIDTAKVRSLNEGCSYIQHIAPERIAAQVSAGQFVASANESNIAEADAIIICVPTPLGKHHEPNLSYVTETLDALVPHLRAGQLISLESTTYPGTTDEEVLPRLRSRGLEPGRDVFVVFSPEREDPGNLEFTTETIPKVVGGHTPDCLEAGLELYGAVVGKVVPVSSTRAAEMTKLLENIYRSVNIGLVNELKVLADAMGINIWEVVAAAATKPFGFTPFYPGPGLGGHCIPIDPFYLTWKAREYGIHTRFIELAGEINESMPAYVVRRLGERLNREGKPLRGSRVLVMGLAYKANVDDMRESPTFRLMDLLKAQDAEVAYFDPHIPVITPTREHANWTGVRSIEWREEVVKSFDCVLISTKHSAFNLEQTAAWASCIVDTRNAMSEVAVKPGQVTCA